MKFDFSSFLAFLKKEIPITARHLEHGSLESISALNNELKIKYLFSKKSNISYEYLKEKDVFHNLIEKLSSFSGFSQDKIFFNIKLSDEKVISKVEQDKIKEMNIMEDRKKLFLKDPVILEAQKIFSITFKDINTK